MHFETIFLFRSNHTFFCCYFSTTFVAHNKVSVMQFHYNSRQSIGTKKKEFFKYKNNLKLAWFCNRVKFCSMCQTALTEIFRIHNFFFKNNIMQVGASFIDRQLCKLKNLDWILRRMKGNFKIICLHHFEKNSNFKNTLEFFFKYFKDR